MNITVYLGAKEGNDPALKRAVQELGQWIGQSGNALVYGGSKTGLMGEIAKSVLDAGGTVTGVETTLFMQDDLQYDGLTELIVTETITERKTEIGGAMRLLRSPAERVRWRKSPKSCPRYRSSSWMLPAFCTT